MRELVFYHEEEGVIVICRKQREESDLISSFQNEGCVAWFAAPVVLADDFILLGEL